MKKLIPCNLVMLLIALVGALSLLFMPLLSLNLSEAANGLLLDWEKNLESSEDAEEGKQPAEGTEEGEQPAGGTEEGEEDLSVLTSILDTEISITTVKFGKIALAPNPGAAFLTQFLLYKGGPVENMLLGSIVSGSVVSTAGLSGETIGKIDYHKLREILYELENENANVDEVIDKYINELKEQVGADAFKDFDEGQIKKFIVDGVNYVKDDLGGKFTTEALVCIALTGGKKGGPTDYETLANQLAEGDLELGGDSGDESSPVNFVGEIVGMVAGYGSYIGYGFYAMLVLLLPWALFILLCLLHIFIKNKRCATWYLFTFGCLPCILFWLAPMIAKPLLPKLLGSTGSTIAAALGAVGSFAWISGACLVVMWLIWLVWMRPLKKKAKFEKQAEEDLF